MFEQAFKNLDVALRKDSGCSTELDYIEQTSWVLFLKYLDDFEADREASAKLNGERFFAVLGLLGPRLARVNKTPLKSLVLNP